MDAPEHRRHLQRDGEALVVAAARDLHASVPSTDWTTTELLDHTTAVHRWMAAQWLDAAGEPGDHEILRSNGDPVTFYREGLTVVLDTIDRLDPDTRADIWAGLQGTDWLARRMAQETAVHRWDAQAAVGDAEPIDPALAADGIDEMLEEFVPGRFDGEAFGAPARLHLHSTDDPAGHEGEWMISIGDGVTWSHEHGKGDVAVRAASSDLLLLLWGRIGADGLEVFGDDDVITRWQDAARF